MTRRQAKNRTGIPRIEGIPYHDAWVAFVCIKCGTFSVFRFGRRIWTPEDAYEAAEWKCAKCGFVHSRESNLPFMSWPARLRTASRLATQRFWRAFFRSATEQKESYWKQCNTCGRILPFQAFSRHERWGPLERQMECRACKAVINSKLNPRRTADQLHEGGFRRRVADMLLKGQNERIGLKALFRRFDGKCFKTKMPLDIKQRRTWAVDHILPSKYLYPLTVKNAALLSHDANENKHDQWPSKFYKNNELIRLAQITGADLGLLSSAEPVINPNIDVNACVKRALVVREHSNLPKRIAALKRFFESYGLVDRLSQKNKNLLGLK